tara:strand:- start:2153 stop:3391 length:1239 start_codon:yes stop_codon:yes gene_type:complete
MLKKLAHSASLVSNKESMKKIVAPEFPIYCVSGKYHEQDKYGILHRTTKEVLIRKYGNEVKHHFNDVLGFTFYPDNFVFKQIVDSRYNTFKAFKNKAKKGSWRDIEEFLNHIFGEQYTMGVEYFWNLYLHPIQKLPLLALVSEKKSTGKTTFLNFVRDVFGHNVITISSHDISGNFNGVFAEGYIFTSDEHFERSDRKATAEKIKHYVTADTIRVERKGMEAQSIKFYGKFIFTSNDEQTLTNIEGENRRFWIRQIPAIDKDNFELGDTLREQIPAFLFYLKEEFTPRGERGQLYFTPSELQTDASRLIQAHSKSEKFQEISEAIQTYFEEHPDDQEAKTTPSDLAMFLGEKKQASKYIRKVLKKEFKMKPQENQRYRNINGMEKVGTPFAFLYEDFVEGELKEPLDDDLPF